ncbi:MAG TPA: DUF1707 domain-containing protein [Chloroflexota bacterium]|nr:DUF1707 domain-containing protein [Chloroflexota bacterium]
MAGELAVRASDAERRETTERLKRACVEGRLTLDEFGERVERALALRTRGDLDALTADLPVTAGGGAVVRADQRTAVSTTLAFMSSADRTGRWRIDEQSRVIAVMGACKLDLRSVTISAPATVIRAYVLMGNVNVIVPEGVEVELDGLAVMGSRSMKLKGPAAAPGAPVVRIEGWVLMGDLTVRDRP